MSWLRNVLRRWFDRRRDGRRPSRLEELETRTDHVLRRLHALGIEVEVIVSLLDRRNRAAVIGYSPNGSGVVADPDASEGAGGIER
jgi:hypothetical protein